MKRFLFFCVLVALAASTIVLAQSVVLNQSSSQATLRTPSGDRLIYYVQQGGQTYVSATEVVNALGGIITPESSGFKVTLGKSAAAFGPDSRFGVVGNDLIEMPVAPISVEGKPFVAWQFFQGLLPKAADLDATWNEAAHILDVHTRQASMVAVQVAVTNLQGISKIVLTLSAPAEYSIVKEPAGYTVHFRSPLQAPFAEQAFEDPNVAHVSFSGSDLRIQLTSPDVVGDTYRLDNPFRIVLDLHKGAPVSSGPVVAQPEPGIRKPAAEPPGVRTIVVDPGHGGKEVGAVGPGGLLEKDITLAVAKKLAAALESRINARVVLTREDDTIVSLDQRTAIANQYHADLFLSIHMNAAVVKGAKGSETYFLSLDASDEIARHAADAENAVSVPQPAGSADLKLILWDLAQQEYLQESSRFAQHIQEEMNAAAGVENRGVKQAPFKVLVGATMPAALVEVGFISNPDEEGKLKSDSFQNLMVEALVRAVQKYKTEYETRIGVIRPLPPLAGGIQTKAAAVQQKGRT